MSCVRLKSSCEIIFATMQTNAVVQSDQKDELKQVGLPPKINYY